MTRHRAPATAGDPIDSRPQPQRPGRARAERAARASARPACPHASDDAGVATGRLAGAEIAGALGKSPAAVKMLRLRALAELRARLRPGPPAPEGDPR